jgi:hypothetical protein
MLVLPKVPGPAFYLNKPVYHLPGLGGSGDSRLSQRPTLQLSTHTSQATSKPQSFLHGLAPPPPASCPALPQELARCSAHSVHGLQPLRLPEPSHGRGQARYVLIFPRGLGNLPTANPQASGLWPLSLPSFCPVVSCCKSPSATVGQI